MKVVARKTGLFVGLILVLILGALAAGCSSGDSTSSDGMEGNASAGKAQALVFTTPT